jgi:hypothetical protein
MTVRIALALAAFAAGLSASAVLSPSSASTPAVTPASYPSCGVYWNRNRPVSAAERKVNACIVRAAREGRRARAVAALTTIEGDPIVSYVFVRGARDVLVVVDSTKDRFGARSWQRSRCTRLVVTGGYLGWTGCVPLGTGKPLWLKPVRLRA